MEFNMGKNKMTDYQKVIYKTNYARWNGERREGWSESVGRYGDFFKGRVDSHILNDEHLDAIKSMDVMPSMRALWSAGKALDVSNIAGFNCAYLVFEKVKDFADHLYILMNGAGSGYSVERQIICNLPEVAPTMEKVDEVIVVEDSKLGWAKATEEYFTMLFDGKVPDVDYSKIRPKGAILKTFGGRASGAEPLKELFDFMKVLMKKARGRKITSVEANDIACYIANVVVSGGVRRSACISLSNLSDRRMANAKSGEFWVTNPHRAMANNSAVYTEKPDIDIFMEEWITLMKSGTGERGIVNREAIHKKMLSLGRTVEGREGVNPCGEVNLKPKQFCNLTEVVIRPDDNLDFLCEKVRVATILGMVQATLTDFPFIDSKWGENARDETILGVSLTGLKDHYVLQNRTAEAEYWLYQMRRIAHITARFMASQIGIPVPKAVTTVKPSGTVSQLVGCSSGIHASYSEYYIRRVRISTNDPMARLLIDSGVKYSPEVGQTLDNANTFVFDFPMKAPDGAKIVGEETAIDQLEYWEMITDFWADHNASCTIYVGEDEWLDVGAWVYKNFDNIIGLSFLPLDDHIYQLAPYEAITEEEWADMQREMKPINFSKLTEYEKDDYTTGAKTLACVGGACEV
jgi:ribonucleoside-diphosphate reductase alpha chain